MYKKVKRGIRTPDFWDHTEINFLDNGNVLYKTLKLNTEI